MKPDATATGNASTSDILSTLKNLVTAIATLTQTYLNVSGLTVATAISAPTVLKSSNGRVARVSVTTSGSAVGHIYDSAQLGVTTKPLWVIPQTPQASGEPFSVNLPASQGILVVPGSGQTVAVSYS